VQRGLDKIYKLTNSFLLGFPMKLILASLFFISSFNSYATSSEQIQKVLLLQKQYNEKNIDSKAYYNELTKCSSAGNKYCSSILGNIYFNKKKYHLAYPYLIKSQGFLYIFNKKYAPSEWALAYIYDNGLGVLQNSDKAIIHYKKCALIGEQNCAFNIGAIYYQKAIDFSSSKVSLNKSYNYLIQSYAWYKVSQALGKKKVITIQTGKKENIFTLLSTIKEILNHEGEGWYIKAEKLAEQTCASIPLCIQ
jgi:TPR repeat protein